MVGVPGRSKACRTCRRRRKACDQKRPICGQCTLSRIPCGGYDQPLVFVNSHLEHGDRRGSSLRFTPAAYSVATQTRASQQVEICSSLMEKPLQRTAQESQFSEIYWTALLPYGEAFPSKAVQYSTTGWTNAMQQLCQLDPVVRIAFLANTMSMAAEKTVHSSLMLHGRWLYGVSLRMMRHSLSQRSRPDVANTLAACALLVGYELYLSQEEDAAWLPAPKWLSHTSGELAIILAAGPESFIHHHAHDLFVDYRLHLIYPYIDKRQDCPLSSKQWKLVPWSIRPKSTKDQLIDIFVDIPSILEELASLEGPRSPQKPQDSRYQTLEDRCWEVDRQLLLWSASRGEATVRFVEAIILAPDDEHTGQQLAVPSIDLAMAHLGIIYWTIRNLLSQALCWLRTATLSCDDTYRLPARIDPHLYCRKVASLIPYFTKPQVGCYLISFIGFPVSVAASFLARESSEQSSLEARALLASAFRGAQGKHLRRFLSSWPWLHPSETELFS